MITIEVSDGYPLSRRFLVTTPLQSDLFKIMGGYESNALCFWHPRNHKVWFVFCFWRNHSNHIGQGCRLQVHCTARLSDSFVREQRLSRDWLWPELGFTDAVSEILGADNPYFLVAILLSLVNSIFLFSLAVQRLFQTSCGYTYSMMIVWCSLNASRCVLDIYWTTILPWYPDGMFDYPHLTPCFSHHGHCPALSGSTHIQRHTSPPTGGGIIPERSHGDIMGIYGLINHMVFFSHVWMGTI